LLINHPQPKKSANESTACCHATALVKLRVTPQTKTPTFWAGV